MYKFRTMRPGLVADGNPAQEAARVTPLGHILRRTSLDELPQFINILRGEMSWIGPRPLLPQYLELYNDRQMLRHTVRPGITGWAQVNGRNGLPWAERLELDAHYAENLSFGLDAKIALATLKKLASPAKHETEIFPPFKGNPGGNPE